MKIVSDATKLLLESPFANKFIHNLPVKVAVWWVFVVSVCVCFAKQYLVKLLIHCSFIRLRLFAVVFCDDINDLITR